MIGKENRKILRKPASVPLCPPQIPHDLTRARSRRRGGEKPGTYRLSYGTAVRSCLAEEKMGSNVGFVTARGGGEYVLRLYCA
jgi:hypothetical protein